MPGMQPDAAELFIRLVFDGQNGHDESDDEAEEAPDESPEQDPDETPGDAPVEPVVEVAARRAPQRGDGHDWPSAGCALLAGGFRVGQHIGETDRYAQRPMTRAYGPRTPYLTAAALMAITSLVGFIGFRSREAHAGGDPAIAARPPT